MIRTIIVDDEKDSLTVMTQLLQDDYPADIEVCATFRTADEAFTGICAIKPDLVFLDVELNGTTAFDLLERLGQKRLNVVFMTGHRKYAVDAFNANAIDYLMKPVDPDRLEITMAKVKKELANQKIWESIHGSIPEQLSVRPAGKDLGKLIIASVNGIILEDLQNILWLESAKVGVKVHLVGDKSLLDYKTSIAEYHTRLENSNFYLVHESRLVNITHLKSYSHGEGKVTMKNDQVIYVSERRRAGFKAYIGRVLR